MHSWLSLHEAWWYNIFNHVGFFYGDLRYWELALICQYQLSIFKCLNEYVNSLKSVFIFLFLLSYISSFSVLDDYVIIS